MLSLHYDLKSTIKLNKRIKRSGLMELHTILNLFSSDTNVETANATRQHAASARYVLITARCWSSPGARAELNDGQYNQRNTVPVIKVMEAIQYQILIHHPHYCFKYMYLKQELNDNSTTYGFQISCR